MPGHKTNCCFLFITPALPGTPFGRKKALLWMVPHEIQLPFLLLTFVRVTTEQLEHDISFPLVIHFPISFLVPVASYLPGLASSKGQNHPLKLLVLQSFLFPMFFLSLFTQEAVLGTMDFRAQGAKNTPSLLEVLFLVVKLPSHQFCSQLLDLIIEMHCIFKNKISIAILIIQILGTQVSIGFLTP